MQDPLETVGVGRWNLPEHVADDVRATVLQAELCRPQLCWIIEDFRQIQDRAGQMRVRIEKSANQTPVSPAYVTDCPNT